MQIHSAQDLFNSELLSIYAAEKQLTGGLPDLSQAAQADAVRQRVRERIMQGQNLLQRIDLLLDQINLPRDQVRNEAVEGLIEDARDLLDCIDSDDVKDAALIGAVQKIEHYCIAAWGNAAALGRNVGQQPAVDTFEQALDQGKRFDKALSELAMSQANPAGSKAGPTAH